MNKETIDKIRYDAEMAEIEYRGDDKYASSQLAYEKLVRDYEFTTVLDIGCGTGYISDFFSKHGKTVTACDYGRSFRFKENKANDVVVGDYNKIEFTDQFDCIWCSHVLEHQLNVQGFLEKINHDLIEGGTGNYSAPAKG